MFIAIATALIFESLTVFVFYSYLEKENKAIVEQKNALWASEQRNELLLKELLKMNSSVAVVMSGLGAVNHAIETADHHLGNYEHSSASELTRMKTMVEMLRSENSALKSKAGSSKRPISDIMGHNSGKRWLTIGIPTVPRKGNLDYLSQTVDAIINQLPTRPDDPFYQKVMVVVLNNRPGQHVVFNKVKARVERGPHRAYFKFEEVAVQDSDDVNNPEHNANVPGSKVRNPLHPQKNRPRDASARPADSHSLLGDSVQPD